MMSCVTSAVCEMQASLVTVLLFAYQSLGAPTDISKSALEMRQTELSCQLKNNLTLKSDFHHSVRREYGFFGLQPYGKLNKYVIQA